MAMTKKERTQLLGLIIAVGLGTPVGFWMYWRTPTVARVQVMQTEMDSLRAAVDTARADLAQGTVEALRETVGRFESALGIMRELVPTENEVTSLIDSVSTQAQLRGVEILSIQPQATDFSGSFQLFGYQFVVVGPYDEIGEFLSDIASLRRVMVAYDVSLQRANPGDLAGFLVQPDRTYLRVTFMIRTFVKADPDEFPDEIGASP